MNSSNLKVQEKSEPTTQIATRSTDNTHFIESESHRNYENWSKEELVKEIKKLLRRKKYGVVWEEKEEDVVSLCRIKLPILKEVYEKSITDGGSLPTNLLIEGDNFHTLSVLNYTHEGNVDLIFIDPPYNTGNGDFSYNDNIVDKNDVYRHSKWLSFMSHRLKLAKSLLKKTGTIFITIDDNEYAQLKLLCDDIFEESNFVGTVCWKHRNSVSNDLIISQNHNYILIYAKDFKTLFANKREFRLEKELTGFSNPDNDSKGPYKLTPVDGPGGSRKGNPYYEFLGVKGYWRYSYDNMQKMYEDGRIVKRGKTLSRKYFLYEAEASGGKVVTTWWDDAGTTTEGTRTLNEMIGEGKFNNPKPVSLLKKIIKLSSGKSSLILDFFAGSGTTGQAVLELNREDNGQRRFILCTNNENNICTTVCYPRLYKTINSGEAPPVKTTSNGVLRYYVTDFVDAEPTDINKKFLVDRSTDILCLKEDCFENVKEGNSYKIFKGSNERLLCIIYDDDGIKSCKEEIKKLGKLVSLYVFSLDEGTKDDEFSDVKDLVNLKPIPASILNVYRRLFK